MAPPARPAPRGWRCAGAPGACPDHQPHVVLAQTINHMWSNMTTLQHVTGTESSPAPRGWRCAGTWLTPAGAGLATQYHLPEAQSCPTTSRHASWAPGGLTASPSHHRRQQLPGLAHRLGLLHEGGAVLVPLVLSQSMKHMWHTVMTLENVAAGKVSPARPAPRGWRCAGALGPPRRQLPGACWGSGRTQPPGGGTSGPGGGASRCAPAGGGSGCGCAARWCGSGRSPACNAHWPFGGQACWPGFHLHAPGVRVWGQSVSCQALVSCHQQEADQVADARLIGVDPGDHLNCQDSDAGLEA